MMVGSKARMLDLNILPTSSALPSTVPKRGLAVAGAVYKQRRKPTDLTPYNLRRSPSVTVPNPS